MFRPRFEISSALAKQLMSLEADRQAILELPIDVEMLAGLRHTARLAATHYSTQIEGNRLTQVQVEEAIAGVHFPGRERDEAEVRNYYRALEQIEHLASSARSIAEDDIKGVHGLVLTGKPAQSPYRDRQNVIRDASSGGIVYMPPEAPDVPVLMGELFAWLDERLSQQDLPAPLVAAAAHYQYATVHPYYDGNGRAARLLTTLVLHKSGYALKGIYSLDQHYARDLHGYYGALAVGPSHNYYLGRAEADITGFLEYFCRSMADALGAVRVQAARAAERGAQDINRLLRRLDPRQRLVLELYRDQGVATASGMAAQLGLTPRGTAALCGQWVASGFLVVHDPARKTRSYRLSDDYEDLISSA